METEIPKWKIRCSLLAQCVDEWRLLPRFMIAGYGWFVYDITNTLLAWYMLLPAAERTLESSGMAVGIFTALVGFGTPMLNFYLKSERKHRELSEE